jgi:3-deoxy-D-manno-octulosonic-acid transferase
VVDAEILRRAPKLKTSATSACMMRRMFVVYEILLWLVFAVALPWFLVVGLVRGKYLSTARERFGRHDDAPSRNDLWIQAVSVGETVAARTIVSAIQKKRPDLSIVITTTTITGQEMAGKLFPKCRVAYFPFDFSRSVQRFLDHFSPRVYVMVETEIWPNATRLCAKRGIPIGLVNGRISDRSAARYRSIRSLLGPILDLYRLFVVREEIDRERLIAMGAPAGRIEVAGNVKFDFEISAAPLEIEPRVIELAKGRPIAVLGSVVEGEEDLIVPILLDLASKGVFTILAPRKPERFDAVARKMQDAGVSFLRRTSPAERDDADVLMLDSIGELARIYKLATVAFVGGSIVPTGGHNPIEPAAAGVPVTFGPHMTNFREIAAVFLERDAAIEVSSAPELCDLVVRLCDDEATRAGYAARARGVIDSNRGAADRIADRVIAMLG